MELQDTPIPQTPSIPPTPPAPKTNSSLVLIMSIFLIITVAIAGLFYFQIQKLSKELSKYQAQASPTPTTTTDPTANWKTYTNSAYGFSFQYPPDLKLSENCTVYAMGTHITCLQSSDFGFRMDEPDRNRPKTGKTITSSNGFGLFIDIRNINYQYDISTLQKDYQGSYDNVTLITLNNISALRVSSNNNTEKISWIMVHNKNVYRILSPFNTQKYPIIDQILSTFKFIEAAPSASPSVIPTATPTSLQ